MSATCRRSDGNIPDSPPMTSWAFLFYKRILSPMLHLITPAQCKYLPTCSEYAYIALARFGIIRGAWLAVRRILRCHPWASGGLDPVPENSKP
jgi:putative membrane protein insertion efficiency factor